jgi:hypothetical protein
MKKILLITLMLFLLTGCLKTNAQKKEDALKKAATEYYEKYAKEYLGIFPDTFDVSIENLKSANDRAEGEFDLKIFDKCETTSKASLSLNDEGEIVGYTFDLTCQ